MSDVDTTITSNLSDMAQITPEVDYDINPTKLYKHIEKKEFIGAIDHCNKFPHESETWVVKKDEVGAIRWRLLPLHTALMIRACDALIKTLLKSYPNGAKESDDQGMFAIHLAFRHSASEAIINILLDIYPDGLHMKDGKGRIPLQLANKGSEKRKGTNKFRAYAYSLIQNDKDDIISNHKRRLNEANALNMKQASELRESKLKLSHDNTHEEDEINDKVEDLEMKLKSMTEIHEKAMSLFEKRKKSHLKEKAFLTNQVENATETSESTLSMFKEAQENHEKNQTEMKQKNRDLNRKNEQNKELIVELNKKLNALTGTLEAERLASETAHATYSKERDRFQKESLCLNNTVSDLQNQIQLIHSSMFSKIYKFDNCLTLEKKEHESEKTDMLTNISELGGELNGKESNSCEKGQAYEGGGAHLTEPNSSGIWKVEEHETHTTDEITHLLNEDKINEASKSIDALISKNISMEEQLESLQQKYNDLTILFEKSNETCDEYKVKSEENEVLQNKIKDLHDENTSGKSQIDSLTESMTRLSKLNDDETARFEEEEMKIKAKLLESNDKLNKIFNENESLKEEVKKLQDENASGNARIKVLSENIANVSQLKEDESARFEMEEAKQKTKIIELEKEIESLKTELSDKISSNNDQVAKYERLLKSEETKSINYLKIMESLKKQMSDSSDKLQTHNTIYETEKKEMEGMLLILQDRLNQLDAEYDVKTNMLNRLMREFEEYKVESDSQIRELEDKAHDLEERYEASQIQLKHLRKQTLKSSIDEEANLLLRKKSWNSISIKEKKEASTESHDRYMNQLMFMKKQNLRISEKEEEWVKVKKQLFKSSQLSSLTGSDLMRLKKQSLRLSREEEALANARKTLFESPSSVVVKYETEVDDSIPYSKYINQLMS